MTKQDLADKINQAIGISQKESKQLVDQLFALIKEQLIAGDHIKISGFGIFNVRDKKTRRGRNPQTGTELKLDARRVLKFKASPVLKKLLSQSPDQED